MMGICHCWMRCQNEDAVVPKSLSSYRVEIKLRYSRNPISAEQRPEGTGTNISHTTTKQAVTEVFEEKHML